MRAPSYRKNELMIAHVVRGASGMYQQSGAAHLEIRHHRPQVPNLSAQRVGIRRPYTKITAIFVAKNTKGEDVSTDPKEGDECENTSSPTYDHGSIESIPIDIPLWHVQQHYSCGVLPFPCTWVVFTLGPLWQA